MVVKQIFQLRKWSSAAQSDDAYVGIIPANLRVVGPPANNQTYLLAIDVPFSIYSEYRYCRVVGSKCYLTASNFSFMA